MGIIDSFTSTFRKLATEPETATLAELQASERHGEAALSAARESLESLGAEGRANALQFLAGDATALKKHREKLSAAQQQVEHLEIVLAQVKAQRAHAQQDATGAELTQQWKACADLLERREAAAKRLQVALSIVVKENAALLELTEQAWQSVPVKPDGRPPTFTKQGIAGRLQLYLFGLSNGLMGRGANAYVESQRPDLQSQIREANAMVLRARSGTKEAERV